MAVYPILFYVFAAILVFAAGMVITVRNPVHAVLFLVLAFFTSAALWLLLEAEFLAIALVLVYVGAVMVLFLFVVMMLDINFARLREGFIRHLPVGLLVAFLMLIEMAIAIAPEALGLDRSAFGPERYGDPIKHGPDYSNTEELGGVLYTVYVYPFEIAAAILLVAIVAAIALTMRKRPQAKTQDPAEQASVRRGERVRLVSMAAKKKQQTEGNAQSRDTENR